MRHASRLFLGAAIALGGLSGCNQEPTPTVADAPPADPNLTKDKATGPAPGSKLEASSSSGATAP